MRSYRFDTRLVHVGERPADRADWRNGTPTSAPIHASTTFLYPTAQALDAAFAVGGDQVVYTRWGNPTVQALEALMSDLEDGRGAVACSSGMAALYLALLAAGTPRGATEPHPRHILASRDLYGATETLLRDFFAAQSVRVSYCDMSDPAAVKAAVYADEPDVVLLESLSNPLLKWSDVEAIAHYAHQVGARVVVDATLATPVLHRPLSQGADIVVHSATKYLSGHGDATGGILVARAGLLLDTARRYAIQLGMILGPFEARLIARGIRTLGLRVHRQCESAMTIAKALRNHPRIRRVIYPGLPEHPQHSLMALQTCGLFGGLVSFELADATREAAFAFMNRLKLILPATSLGDIYSLITYPPISSHRELTEVERAAHGISDGLLRLSVGIEDARDILADIEEALGP
ncbi:MAG: PLP-dependent aspartate aminotransferase family protein [Thermoflexales bacterium]|nr:PLP-dependent aspartate aminotransferase family protein [Thermoflexales bacterium]MDW8352303.1 PLP-dependent aspartate aminotransferase family protein [Anaerolineae bacterium]